MEGGRGPGDAAQAVACSNMHEAPRIHRTTVVYVYNLNTWEEQAGYQLPREYKASLDSRRNI